MSWLSKGNIHTVWIQEALGVSREEAIKVHSHIDKYYDFDWSEATTGEINLVSHMAYEDLMEIALSK